MTTTLLKFLKHILLTCLILNNLALTLEAQDKMVLSFDDTTTSWAISGLPGIEVWVDSFSLDFRSGLKNQTYRAIDSNFKLENPNYVYWFKFNVKNKSPKELQYWLDANVFDSLSLIQIIKEDSIIQHRGLLIDYSPKEKNNFKLLREHKYGFPINLLPQTSTVFLLRIKNIIRYESTFDQIKIIPYANPNPTAIIWNLIVNFVFFGILTFLALFSLLQFFQNKDLAYFFYFLYLTTCNMYMWWKFLVTAAPINIQLYDLNGSLLKTILSSTVQEAGSYQMTLASDDLQAGMYYLRMRNEQEQLVKKVMLVK